MKISIISGSQRPNSQSAKVAAYLAGRLPDVVPGASTYVLELVKDRLPLWDETMWSGDESELKAAWKPVSDELASSDAAIVISPEWHGMVPPTLKNFLLLCTSELAHKPGMIVGVSASVGGSYPVAELRISGYKNNRICWVPDHAIIRGVGKVLTDNPENPEEDTAIRDRLDYSMKMLAEYAKALKSVRDSGVVDLKTYPFGM